MATNESLVLDGIELNQLTGDYVLRTVEFPPPRKRYLWAEAADADGAALIRDPTVENRTITASIRVAQQPTKDAALAKIGALVDKLEEAERRPDGLPLIWTPAGATKTLTFYILTGEINDIPVTRSGEDRGWFINYPVVNLTLTCKPYGYRSSEQSISAVTSSAPLVTVTLPSVGGDVPAEARLVATDAASQVRRYLEWGIEQRYYNAATSLLLDSDSLVTTGYAGTGTTRTGAYDPGASGNNIVRVSVTQSALVGVSTGDQQHVGTFRVKARVWTSSTTIRAALRWQEGDGPFRTNAWALPPVVNNWSEIDLGLISIAPATLGTQRWNGEIVVDSPGNTGTDSLDIDYLILIPADEGYGRARAPLANQPPLAAVANDQFTGATAGSTLDGRVAPTGGTWAANLTFLLADAPTASDETVKRTTVSDASPAYAVLGATSYTDMVVAANIQSTLTSPNVEQGVLARYGSSTQHLAFVVRSGGFFVRQVIGGVTTELVRSSGAVLHDNAGYRIALAVYSNGQFVATLTDSNGAKLFERAGFSSELGATGTLNNGKFGLYDMNAGATGATRYYDLFTASTPSPEGVVINSGRGMQVRHDATLRESSGGGVWGPVPGYRGGRFYVPPSGAGNRTSRVAVKAHRNNIESAASENVTDSLTVQVFWTERYLAVPR